MTFLTGAYLLEIHPSLETENPKTSYLSVSLAFISNPRIDFVLKNACSGRSET